MARLLRPKKSVSRYMTAHAGYAPLQYMDGRTGEPFAPTEAQSEVEEHKLHGVLIRRILRVNRCLFLARVTLESLIKE